MQRVAPSRQSTPAYERIVGEICALAWECLDSAGLLRVAKAYYFFSVQFRENLEIACRLHSNDRKLAELHRGECDTENLSPFPGVTAPGEKLNHDEFMRRLLALQPVDADAYLDDLGKIYLDCIRNIDERTRASSIASYEDGGLSRVFMAMLRAPDWQGPGQQAFRFFLEEHIRFDTDDDGGHGNLSRHLEPTDAIAPLWAAFKELLVSAVPQLAVSDIHSISIRLDAAPGNADSRA